MFVLALRGFAALGLEQCAMLSQFQQLAGPANRPRKGRTSYRKGIGTGEILMILLVALLVLGPSRVIEFARSAGKVARSIRKASFDLSSTVTKELEEGKSHSSGDCPHNN